MHGGDDGARTRDLCLDSSWFRVLSKQSKFGGFAILNCQFGWLRGWRKLLKRKDFLVAGACNHRNCLVLPFRLELIRVAA
jgi:hypothetical protein